MTIVTFEYFEQFMIILYEGSFGICTLDHARKLSIYRRKLSQILISVTDHRPDLARYHELDLHAGPQAGLHRCWPHFSSSKLAHPGTSSIARPKHDTQKALQTQD